MREFRINDYGAPDFPEVVLAATRSTLRRRRTEIVHALAAIALGAEKAVADPQQAARVIYEASEGDPRLIRAQTLALLPALRPPLRLNASVLSAWSRFDADTGLLTHPLDLTAAFNLSLARDALRLAKRAATAS